MKYSILLLAFLLSGCLSLNGQTFANRLAVTLALDECRIDSRLGDYGLSTDLDKRDCEVVREAIRLKALQDYIRAQQEAQVRSLQQALK